MALKYLDCSHARLKQLLPPLPVCLETLICHDTPLSDISALVACTALKHLDCCGYNLRLIPPLPSSLLTLRISGTRCAYLSPLAVACAVGLRTLCCSDTLVRDLTPLLACKQLGALECDGFEGVNDQVRQLHQVLPDLAISIKGGYEESVLIGEEDDDDCDEEVDEEEAEDEGDGDGCEEGEGDWDALEYEKEDAGWGDGECEGGLYEGNEEFTEF